MLATTSASRRVQRSSLVRHAASTTHSMSCRPHFSPTRPCFPSPSENVRRFGIRSVKIKPPVPKPTRMDASILQATTPVARELVKSGLWDKHLPRSATEVPDGEGEEMPGERRKPGPKPRRRRSRTKIKADKTRVNVVSGELCDDIFRYVGHTFERHKGCDIVDIAPGVGLWSTKLHNFLRPRAHILLEPDTELYLPFLEPLMSRPGVKYVATNGLVWENLLKVLTPEYLPHQKVVDASNKNPERNDTLLVTAQVAYHPPRRFSNFESVAQLLLFQLVHSIRAQTLFQRYGQVRMLVWTRVDDKGNVLAKNMQRHKRASIESLLSCEWMRELTTTETDTSWFSRDETLDLYSAIKVAQRMRDAGLVMPEGRAPQLHRKALMDLEKGVDYVPGLDRALPPAFSEEAEEAAKPMRAKRIRDFRQQLLKEKAVNTSVMGKLFDVTNAVTDGSKPRRQIKKRIAEMDAELEKERATVIANWQGHRDNAHYLRQTPPVLHWDRRIFEPLIVQPTEFFPNSEMGLLDIQPQRMHPLLTEVGPQSTRSGDSWELIIRQCLMQSTTDLRKVLNGIWPGAGNYICPRCPSLTDPAQGGVNVDSKYCRITPRMMNERQWMEVLERWMEWPFRPAFEDLVVRVMSEVPDETAVQKLGLTAKALRRD